MGKNLIHNYLNNLNNSQSQQQFEKKNNRSYFGVPSVSSTMEAFDQESDKLIKPLKGKGHLVNGDLVHMPKEFVRDTVYTTKALADGVRGKANDHQLGKLNDLGLKLSGIAIATYLMTKKATPKTKAMEFIGFGTFLASMALWPKLALEIPARIIHGFNFRKQYVDEQGRKKYVSQDPNYIPFDLYKGDKKSENLDVIGDRLGIRRDIPNRHEAVKDQMRKISVQNNTLWMLTAGIATPLMTALTCNFVEPFVGKKAESYTNKKVNTQIDMLDDYLNNRLNNEQTNNYKTKVLKMNETEKVSEIGKVLESFEGKAITKENIAQISDILAKGQDVEMKNAARADVENIIGGKYIATSDTPNRIATAIHKELLAKDERIASAITPDKLEKAVSQGILRGAVNDLLTEVGFMLDNTSHSRVAENFKCMKTGGIDFFAVTEETKNMTPAERLAHNIKSIIMKVNNANPNEDFVAGMSELENSADGKHIKGLIDAKLSEGAENIARNFYEGKIGISEGRESYIRTAVQQLYKENAPRTNSSNKLFATVGKVISDDFSNNRGFILSGKDKGILLEAEKCMRNFSAIDDVISELSHFKLEKASETLVANNWNEVTDLLVKELKIDEKQIKAASTNKAYSNQLLAEKLEAVCSDEKSYKEFITKLANKMAELDEKIDAPNSGTNGRMMGKLEEGITKNCKTAGEKLSGLGMEAMNEKMVSYYDGGLNTNPGSIMSSRVNRLHSRIEGVHSSYMRLLQTAEFFHRASGYEAKVKANGGIVTSEIAKEFGMSGDAEMNEKIIKAGKEMLLDAHTNKFYTKMGFHNDKDFFKSILWSVFRPNKDTEVWNENWSSCTENDTVATLDAIKGKNTDAPRRVFEDAETKQLGQKLKEQMNQLYNVLGTIKRKVVGDGKEFIVVDGSASAADSRASKIFDLLGKSPNDLLHDTLKQKASSAKWKKVFAPILGVTAGVTILAQFFFGKKDSDIKA